MTARRLLPCLAIFLTAAAARAADTFTPPASPTLTFNFNPDWKFTIPDRKSVTDLPGFEAPAFDDSAWDTVSTPHSFNDVDSFRTIISHGGGDRGTYKGLAFYRKHFKLPANLTAAANTLFLEFEGMRQAGDIYLNGKQVGLYENGVTPYGIDITNAVNYNGADNVLAVRVDNRTSYKEKATGSTFEWNANDFNPDHGGINRRVWLHVTSKIYQTLPLYYGLETQGIYIHPDNFNIPQKSCDVTIESEIKNGAADRATVALSAVVVDPATNTPIAKFDADPLDMVAGEKSVVQATASLKNVKFWSPETPSLYDVYTILTVDGKVTDVRKTTTGFRKTQFKGGATTGGVYVNDKFTWLTGYAQRSTDEWAALGLATPDWLHDYTAQMIRDSHANYVRWMHVSPTPVDVDSYDRHGIVEICPAGDKERDVEGRQWEQRAEVMRDSIIYFRNSPSIFFWETGNTVVTVPHMQQMVDIRKQWDPAGGRAMGTRDNDNAAINNALTPIAEYYGVMISQDKGAEAVASGASSYFRGFTLARRDKAPLIEAEDFRDEAARGIWDDYSPPTFGFKKGPQDTYNWNSETFALAQVARYYGYITNRIDNKDPAHARWSGYASIYFSDSDADGRQDSSETARVSGKVDALRLPKEAYFALQVCQNPDPQVHIIGHWTYPADTKKTVYVVANTQSVELFLNGKSIGKSDAPVNIRFGNGPDLGKIQAADPAPGGYIFQFPDIPFTPGELKAVGSNNGKPAANYTLTTAGPPAAIRLTPITAPGGMIADGNDAALCDVEVVDAKGERCPTDEDRIDFTCSGPAIWRGSWQSAKTDSTNNLFINTECGINRIAIRSTLTPGQITLTASRKGLPTATLTLTAKPFPIKDGLSTQMPPILPAH